MPCNDCSRAETCPPCVNEPQGICRCGHGAAYHDAKYGDPQCRLCPEDGERMWRHAFIPADTETAGCEHPDKRPAGSVYDGPGGRKTWLYYRCDDCDAEWREEETAGESEAPEEPTLASALKRVEALERIDPDCIRPTGCRDKLKRGCAHGCAEAADDVTRLGEEMEPEAPECTCSKEPWRYDDPPPGPDIDCPVHGELRFLAPPRRPPYAVAYAVEGGAQYEVALPGDATVRAVDGALVVTHSRPVLALTIVRPMGAEEGA